MDDWFVVGFVETVDIGMRMMDMMFDTDAVMVNMYFVVRIDILYLEEILLDIHSEVVFHIHSEVALLQSWEMGDTVAVVLEMFCWID